MKVVWTAHNVSRSHQRNGAQLSRYFWPWFAKRIDGVIFVNRSSASIAMGLFPELRFKPWTIIPHGHYGPVVDRTIDADRIFGVESARHRLPTAIFFGKITQFKNAHLVLKAFLELPPGSASLQVCGKMSKLIPDTRFLEALGEASAVRRSEILYADRHLEEAELVRRVRAADLAVFPYGEVLNSGAALFALSAGTPIIASNTPLFQELRERVGDEWVILFDDALTPKRLLSALEKGRALKEDGAAPDLSAFAWEGVARDTVRFYDTMLDGGELALASRALKPETSVGG